MKYFTYDELIRSDTARAKGIDNTPTPGIRKNLERLVNNVLDPLREKWGGPIDVSSGYRSPSVNKAVGGVKNSQHMLGEAADLRIYKRDSNGKYIRDSKGRLIVDKAAIRRLFDLVKKSDILFDQLINENNYSWLHISYRDGRNRHQILKL